MLVLANMPPVDTEKVEVLRDAQKTLKTDLLKYLQQFQEITKQSDRAISCAVFNDSSYLLKIRRGRPITPEKYDALVAYFDRKLAEHSSGA